MILFSTTSESIFSSIGFWKTINLLSLAVLDLVDCILCNTISLFDLIRSIWSVQQSNSNNPSVVLINHSSDWDYSTLSKPTSTVDLTEEALREFVTDSGQNDRSLTWCNCKTFCWIEIETSVSISLLFWTNCVVCEFFESNFHCYLGVTVKNLELKFEIFNWTTGKVITFHNLLNIFPKDNDVLSELVFFELAQRFWSGFYVFFWGIWAGLFCSQRQDRFLSFFERNFQCIRSFRS